MITTVTRQTMLSIVCCHVPMRQTAFLLLFYYSTSSFCNKDSLANYVIIGASMMASCVLDCALRQCLSPI